MLPTLIVFVDFFSGQFDLFDGKFELKERDRSVKRFNGVEGVISLPIGDLKIKIN
jgi:hypothetical protein